MIVKSVRITALAAELLAIIRIVEARLGSRLNAATEVTIERNVLRIVSRADLVTFNLTVFQHTGTATGFDASARVSWAAIGDVDVTRAVAVGADITAVATLAASAEHALQKFFGSSRTSHAELCDVLEATAEAFRAGITAN